MEDSRRFLKTLKQEYQLFWHSLKQLFAGSTSQLAKLDEQEHGAKRARHKVAKGPSALNHRILFQLPRAVIMGDREEDSRLDKPSDLQT